MSLSHAVTTGLILFQLAREGLAAQSEHAKSEEGPAIGETSTIESEVKTGLYDWLTRLGLSLEMPNHAGTKIMALFRRALSDTGRVANAEEDRLSSGSKSGQL